MKPTPNIPPETPPPPLLLAFGAHPDDIEFGCGGVIANESRAGRPINFVVCSRGEAASNGDPELRTTEAENGARILGATLEFIELGGDARMARTVVNAVAIAGILRRHRPGIVLAPTPTENQHPDHAVLGHLVRDAARLARYGGLQELRDLPPHAIDQLLFYPVTVEGEPRDVAPVLVDVSANESLARWTDAMNAHASQATARGYVELQITRAAVNGLRAGCGYAIALYPSDPILVDSLAHLGRGARRF
jgi:LmbE family N-acetylglucosaminyl deacetylase